jgi:hypothetical protein
LAWLDIVAEACLQIEVRPDRARIERLHFRCADVAAGRLTLSLEHEAIDVAANPALAFPAMARSAFAELHFAQIEHDF